MWFCQKCNKWYDDSVAIVKHIQSHHPTECTITKVSSPPKSEAKMKMQFPKPSLSKILVKKKPKKSPCINGLSQSPGISSGGQFKIGKKDRPKDFLKSHMYNSSYQKKSLPPDKLNNSDHYMVIGNIDEKGGINKIRTYICKFCCRKFDNSNTLQLHLKTHQTNPKHACHMCGVTAGTFSALMAHYVKHSGTKTSESSKPSSENSVRFKPQQQQLEKQRKGLLQKRPQGINCNLCKKSFQTRKAYNIHYCPPQNKKTEYVCAYCRQVTHSVEEYRDHIQSHSPALQFACKYCSRKFGHKFQLQLHVKQCIHRTIKATTQKRVINRQNNEEKINKKLLPKLEVPSFPIPKIKDRLVNSSSSLGTSSQPSKSESASDVIIIPSPSIKEKSTKKTVSDKDDDIHLRLRPKTTKVTYAAESSPEDNSIAPTRRSARLVNRRHSHYSIESSESEFMETSFEDESSEFFSSTASTHSSSTATSSKAPSPKSITLKTTCPKPTSPKKLISSTSQLKKDDTNKPPSSKPDIILKIPKKKLKMSPTKKNITIQHKQKCSALSSPESKTMSLCCNLCSLVFRSKGSLKRHKKMHTGKPQFVCQYCGKFFYRRDIHRRHEGNVHMSLESQLISCYYCKKDFDTTAELKEHAFSSHSGRALVPERIRRCTPKKQSESKSVIIKSEHDSPFDDTSQEIDDESPLTYNCGSCNHTFHDSPSLVKHFDQFHKSVSNDHVEKPTIEKPVNNVNPSKAVSEVEEIVCSNAKQDCQIKDGLPSILWQKSNETCELCFDKLPEAGMMMCRDKDVHKAIDWYQCSICSTIGQKQQMQEHMLTHMTKIGTFVVNINRPDFNEITHYLSQTNVQIESLTPSKIDRHWESIDTLMEEVECIKCNEIIVDFHLLMQHPCMERSDGQFSCFVRDCPGIICTNFIEMEDHLQNYHYVTVASNSEENMY